MKAIIPVAGIGTRLRPHTHTQPKALVPVAGKPILSHIVDSLIEAGYKEFIFVIGYMGDKIESYIQEKYPKLKAKFIIQQPREGIGHAVWLCRDLVNGGPILIVLGDTIFDVDIKSVLAGSHSSIGVKKVDDPRQFGTVELDDKGFIARMVEKPKIPTSNLAIVGIYKINETKKLMAALDHNIRNNIRTQEEFHLTDGLMKMIGDGIKVTTFPVDNWYDCGSRENLLETNAILLKKNSKASKKAAPENTIIIPPVHISPGCNISNSIIGPNVSIGENTLVKDSVIKDSIIGSFSHLENAVLNHSVIGSDASLKGLSQSLNIGDSTEIDFS